MSDELLRAVKKRRFVKVAKPGSDDAKYLDFVGANASAGNWEGNSNPKNLDAITVRSDAYKIEVLEEFLHGTQAKLDMDMSTANSAILEIHVKDFMIRHKVWLGLSEKDVEALTIMKELYER
ncbi:hypothetical protein [Myxosarcina sp. GI1]|uniref:hypothetical protein n=1 Tax=Myxosarcina sp. GI1 TaxID=1541065 RepID=UPI001C119EF1|nr:hypothetical protein [Myxosarcina sp. GI1]